MIARYFLAACFGVLSIAQLVETARAGGSVHSDVGYPGDVCEVGHAGRTIWSHDVAALIKKVHPVCITPVMQRVATSVNTNNMFLCCALTQTLFPGNSLSVSKAAA